MRTLVIRNRLSIIAEKALAGKYLGLFCGSNDSITKKSSSSRTSNPSKKSKTESITYLKYTVPLTVGLKMCDIFNKPLKF
jgi:hypothetical protein